MPNTLTKASTVVTLPDDILWSDEFEWSAVVERRAFSVSGAVLRDNGVKQAGRLITLQAGQDFAWAPLSVVQSLHALVHDPVGTMVLLYRGTSYTVVWDRDRTPLEAAPVVDYFDPEAADFYALTLRFVTE